MRRCEKGTTRFHEIYTEVKLDLSDGVAKHFIFEFEN